MIAGSLCLATGFAAVAIEPMLPVSARRTASGRTAEA
jgi:hypothetical protein